MTKAVMEASGGYERDWAKAMRQADIEVRIVDPKRVRNFALSAGRLAKNDAIDAEMIAWFAETFSEGATQVYDAACEELQALVKARSALVNVRARLQCQSEHAAPGLVQKAQAPVLRCLDNEIAKLEDAISAKVKSTPDLLSALRSSRVCPGSARPLPQTSLQACPSSAKLATRSPVP
ncbi:IS110 family transposase [Bradyrhizobium sp.]|uniref:IS110 family transposase n=1 Tax=Bradyrhizobium sp. TaxID=376 RepID=UPI0025B87556|nr:transposase [Bradyrhizobium sp.]